MIASLSQSAVAVACLAFIVGGGCGRGSQNATVDARGAGGTGGAQTGGAGGQGGLASDAGLGGSVGGGGTLGAGGMTTLSTSNGGARGDAALATDTSLVGSGGTTVPATSNGGAVGAGGVTGSATCGNKKIEGGEACDDGNNVPFDGCSSDCQVEPACSGDGCTSACGDGILFGGEACDDGNRTDGDGCSADCKVEPGWTCMEPPVGNKIMVPVIYRDFRAHTPTDFESGNVSYLDGVTGMVKATLDADGKPVYSGIGGKDLVASADTFAEWYRDVPGVNHATPSKMPLWNNDLGGFVNRYGPDGETWNVTETAYFCGYVGQELLDSTGKPIPCTSKDSAAISDCTTKLAEGKELLKCTVSGDVYRGSFVVAKVDGNPVFFPVDDDSFTPASERMSAQIPPYYDATSSWPYDLDAAGNKLQHNFSFTTEVRTWFLYDKSKTYTLDFVGDDDVWVFINRRLAVDLGGIHPPVAGSLVIGPDGNGTTTTAKTYPVPPPPATQASVALGLQDGNLYEIAVFQAERQSTGSSFKLTLTGFDRSPSRCSPK
jgi:fibro-slime domain-containing protein